MEPEKNLLGVNILGRLNLYLFGLFFSLLLIFALVYFQFVPGSWDTFSGLLKEAYPRLSFSYSQFRIGIIAELFRSVLYFICGIGILHRQEWGRIITLIIAFISVSLVFITVVLNSSFIQQGIIQAIYPGILIIYFTNKNVGHFFKDKGSKQGER